MAFDSGGPEAVRPWVRPADLTEQYPPIFLELMGWDTATWERAAAPTYPCLVDQDHLVARLYGMPNVPMAVWIDEAGRIVRAAEPAGVSDGFRSIDLETFSLPAEVAEAGKERRRRYLDAIRDWAAKGSESVHASGRRAGGRPRTADEARAEAAFALGLALHRQGSAEAARAAFAEAGRLHPQSWAIRRQAMQLSAPEAYGELAAGPDFWAAVAALGEQPYYEPIHMEGLDAG